MHSPLPKDGTLHSHTAILICASWRNGIRSVSQFRFGDWKWAPCGDSGVSGRGCWKHMHCVSNHLMSVFRVAQILMYTQSFMHLTLKFKEAMNTFKKKKNIHNMHINYTVRTLDEFRLSFSPFFPCSFFQFYLIVWILCKYIYFLIHTYCFALSYCSLFGK